MSQWKLVEKFELSIGDSIQVQNHKIKFKAVPWDNRCPKDVQCIMAGYAVAELELVDDTGQNIAKDINITADQDNLLHPEIYELKQGYKLVTGRFDPYPISTQIIRPEDYTLEVWLVKEDQ